jgi:hypothetical protein
VCFTTAYLLPDTLPVYFLPKQVLIDYLWAFGIGTGVHFVIPHAMVVTNEDVSKARIYLERRCQELNGLCREGLEHILLSIKLGSTSRLSFAGGLFSSQKDGEITESGRPDIGLHPFVARFDQGLETYFDQRSVGLQQFLDEKTKKPSHGLFIVVFVDFLLFQVAQEIRSLVLFIESLRSQGTLSSRQIVYPSMETIRLSFSKVLDQYDVENLIDTYKHTDIKTRRKSTTDDKRKFPGSIVINQIQGLDLQGEPQR